MVSEKVMDYLREVYHHHLRGREYVTPRNLEVSMNVSRPTALEALRRLEKMGFGTYAHGRGFSLNSRGWDFVHERWRAHHAMATVFMQYFGLDPESACREASALEPHASTALIDAMCRTLELPDGEGIQHKGECGRWCL